MSEKLCEVCDRERTPIGEPGCHRHASFPGQAGYLECYRLGCERLPAALAAAEERGRQELRDRLQHLASGIRKGGNDKIAEMIEIVVRNADKGEPLVKLLAAERDTAEERGRRAGIEERDELRALVTRFVEMAHHPTDCDPLEGECSCGLSNLLDDARAALASKKDAALAPRDSGKDLNAKVGRSEDGLPVVNFDRAALHAKDRK